MRNHNVIEAEIAKLEAELEDVKEYECARDSAVHILKNLGWTRVRGQWVKPKPKMEAFDADMHTHIKQGDFCISNSNADIWYVRKVEGTYVFASKVTRIGPMGTVAGISQNRLEAKSLSVIDPKNYMGYHKSSF